MQHTDDDDQAEPSKSQRKRDMDELKRLGMELLEFSDDALRELLLPEVLLEALRTGKRITSNNARKRQMQYIRRQRPACSAGIIPAHRPAALAQADQAGPQGA